MRTPAGKECKYYYADFFRGKATQECRLIDENPEGGKWKPNHCLTCPVPGILLANGCPNMILEGRVESSLLGLRERVKVTASCTQTMRTVEEPKIGCGECHTELSDVWDQALK